ncbi:hypothetical protein [Streptomyces sp. NPDC017941]|uniref:hypothetical protein n=1 Tax=Streptomyces sp. NPDC017941 TaxID=3365018 RepID=UPI00378D71F1
MDDTDLAVLAAFVVYGVCNKEWEAPVLLGIALLLCLGAAWAAGAFERFAQKRRKQQSR